MEEQHTLKTKYEITCYNSDGEVKWEDSFYNIVVDEGLNDNLDKYFKGSSYTGQHYVGLTDGTPSFSSGDTMGSHTGWAEVTAYSEGSRPDLTANLGSVSGQSVDNSGSPATFSINTNTTTIGGAFVSTDSTKGGTTGTLYGGGAFSSGNKVLDSGDTLEITVTLSAS